MDRGECCWGIGIGDIVKNNIQKTEKKNTKEQKSALNHWQKEKDVACGPTERL